jgi:hypothetical protein
MSHSMKSQQKVSVQITLRSYCTVNERNTDSLEVTLCSHSSVVNIC